VSVSEFLKVLKLSKSLASFVLGWTINEFPALANTRMLAETLHNHQ